MPNTDLSILDKRVRLSVTASPKWVEFRKLATGFKSKISQWDKDAAFPIPSMTRRARTQKRGLVTQSLENVQMGYTLIKEYIKEFERETPKDSVQSISELDQEILKSMKNYLRGCEVIISRLRNTTKIKLEAMDNMSAAQKPVFPPYRDTL